MQGCGEGEHGRSISKPSRHIRRQVLDVGEPQDMRARRHVKIGAVMGEGPCYRSHGVLVLLEILAAAEQGGREAGVLTLIPAALDGAGQDSGEHHPGGTTYEQLGGGTDQVTDLEGPALGVGLREALQETLRAGALR